MAKTRVSSFARSVVFTLSLALLLSGLSLPASTQGQTPASGGLRTQGPPSPNLPNLDTTRNTKEVEPKAPVEKKANRCRWADAKCKREKEKKAENLNPFVNPGVGVNGEQPIGWIPKSAFGEAFTFTVSV